MAGPIPSYLSTQTAAQTAFSVPFGLLGFVNAAITAATAAGQFNVTVDCSLFVTEDVSNLRIYLDSLGYHVNFAKDTNNKSLNIDWGKFFDAPGTNVIAFQGTSPWIVAGTVTANQGTSPWVVTGSITTSPDVNVHDGTGVSIGSTGDSLHVAVTNFPATVAVTQSTTPWTVDGTITANQGTSPWVTSVSNFPAVQPVSGTVTALQGTTPWTVDGTIIANQGTSPWNIDGTVAATQSGAWTTGRTWTLSSGTDSVAVTQSTSPWVVSGTVTADAGTGTFSTREAPATGNTVTRVASATSAHTLAAANATRVGLHLYNDSTGVQYVKFGSSASATDFTVRLTAQDYWVMPQPIDQGIITALSGNTNGGVQVTEQTA